MPETPFGSNNPFRRKAPGSGAPPPPGQPGAPGSSPLPASVDLSGPPAPLPSSDYFRSQLQALPHSSQPPPSTSFQKPKVVKKVRVQSPPPSSPESSSSAPDTYPLGGKGEEESSTSSDEGEEEEEEGEDPFKGAPSPLSLSEEGQIGQIGTPPLSSHRPPANPFQKTLEDRGQNPTYRPQLENPSSGGKGSLDVEAFRKLLLTGLGAATGTAAGPQTANPPAPTGDGASTTDASSISRQSVFETTHPQETPRTSHENSDPGDDDQLGLVSEPLAKTQPAPSTLRKKPRPPSSRHGKLIGVDLNQSNRNAGQVPGGILQPSSPSRAGPSSSPGTSPPKQRPSTPSDVNKPLPPAPARSSLDEDPESIFDKEAAGKVPEPIPDPDAAVLPPPRPPTPPNASNSTSAATLPQASRKPAPPPRRNPHARIESKASIAARPNATMTAVAPSGDEPDTARRSSVDSTRSRSSSLRVSIHAPVPPPPRRPNHGSRQSASFTSPSALSFSSIASSNSATSPTLPDLELSSPHPRHGNIADAVSSAPSASTPSAAAGTGTAVLTNSTSSHGHGPTKLSPPPPPPARNQSVRSSGRPASVSSFDATSRRVGREKDGGAAGSGSIPPPPPPPKRSRGGSRDGADGPGRRTSVDGVRVLGGAVVEEPGVEVVREEGEAGAEEAADHSAANDILADLDALQREVDALRGRYEQPGAGGGEVGS
ncbi:hypothetical protein QBC33DRAFT_541014 [Phialemonium atrogriseum]|uniref:Uncharacterized protein n=1 Tax=Phialemonium atrogriseum TaxID=1093897 RepID=A0AAJ0FMS0_9PEZI|nr:uncharacterized protein QBC33DRAFT_541014 [Phialemonium atrogriseum]KAK1766425.1 hypothetical protein QBC33DRAFT_541014 [Phialemonium atrogriseum]